MPISTRNSTAKNNNNNTIKSSLSNDMTSMMDYNLMDPAAAVGKGFPVGQSRSLSLRLPAHQLTPSILLPDPQDELSTFLDLSFTSQSAALPLPTATLFSAVTSSSSSAASYSNAFLTRQDDALLESPLGLSPHSLTASPFDFTSTSSTAGAGLYSSSDFASPLLSGAFGTPELEADLEYPSLFGAAPGWPQQQQLYSAGGVPPSVSLAPTTTMESVSPSLMSLDAELPPLPSSVAASSGRASRKRAPTSLQRERDEEAEQQEQERIAQEDAASRQAVKDKFNGTRNTKIKPIDFDAPTLPKCVVLFSSSPPPSCCS